MHEHKGDHKKKSYANKWALYHTLEHSKNGLQSAISPLLLTTITFGLDRVSMHYLVIHVATEMPWRMPCLMLSLQNGEGVSEI